MSDVSDQHAQLALVEGLLLTMSDRKAPRAVVRRATATGLALLEGQGSVRGDASDSRFAFVRDRLEARAVELRESTLTRPPVESAAAPAGQRKRAARVLRARSGEPNDADRDLQERLLAAGYDVGKGGADGLFGDGTKRAVRRFQRDHGLRMDGVVGRHTLRTLDSVQEAAGASPIRGRGGAPARATGHGMGRGRGPISPSQGGDDPKKKAKEKAKTKKASSVDTAAATSRGGAAISEAADSVSTRHARRKKAAVQQGKDHATAVKQSAADAAAKHPHKASGQGGGQFAPKGTASTARASSGSAGDANTGITSAVKQGAGMQKKPDTNVRNLQKVLDVMGYDLGRPGTDGRFGPKTDAAVKKFQREFGLAADGVVGPKTRKALTKAAKRHVRNTRTGVVEGAIRSEDELREALEAFPTAEDRGRARRSIMLAANTLNLTHILPDTWGTTTVQEAASKTDAQRSANLDQSIEKLVKRLVARGMPEPVARKAAKKRLTKKHGQTEASAEARTRKVTEAAEVGKPGTNWKQVTPANKKKISPIVRHYMKSAHPFTECVRDNRKRFGPRAEAVCAVVKDLGKRTTKWRKGNKSISEAQLLEGAYDEAIAAELFDTVWAPVLQEAQVTVEELAEWSEMVVMAGLIEAHEEAATAAALLLRADDESLLVESAATGTERTRAAARAQVAWRHVEEVDPTHIEEAFGLGLLKGQAFNSRVARNRVGKFIDIAPGSSKPDSLPTHHIGGISGRRRPAPPRVPREPRSGPPVFDVDARENSAAFAQELANRIGRGGAVHAPASPGLPGVADGRGGRPDTVAPPAQLSGNQWWALERIASGGNPYAGGNPGVKAAVEELSASGHVRLRKSGYGTSGGASLTPKGRRALDGRGRPVAAASKGLPGVATGTSKTERVPRNRPEANRVAPATKGIPGVADGKGGKPDKLPRNNASLSSRTASRARPKPASSPGIQTGGPGTPSRQTESLPRTASGSGAAPDTLPRRNELGRSYEAGRARQSEVDQIKSKQEAFRAGRPDPSPEERAAAASRREMQRQMTDKFQAMAVGQVYTLYGGGGRKIGTVKRTESGYEVAVGTRRRTFTLAGGAALFADAAERRSIQGEGARQAERAAGRERLAARKRKR